MAVRFTALASGSSGNAALLEADGFGLLIDCGLRPEYLAERLTLIGRSWANVSAVLLTHTHTDHWNRHTLAHLRRLNLPLIAHPAHHAVLSGTDEYDPLRRAGLTHEYEAGRPDAIGPGWTVRPIPVPHDSDPTFGFRLDGPHAAWSVGYASDVGHPTAELAEAFAGVDLLALEFNHDVRMQKTSRRPAMLINRVLGDDGHLSNAQAATLTRAVAGSGGLQCVVQLHLSRDCNRPELAAVAGREAIRVEAPTAALVTASQRQPTRPFEVNPSPVRVVRPVRFDARRTTQPMLPGLGD
jgi:phosphoribosyl 1,2-cyclic phosphodiesterase